MRLYATIFKCSLAVVLVWLLLTVLRGRGDRFAFGALLSGFAVVLLINAMNPDAALLLFDALPEISEMRNVPDLTVEEVILNRYREVEEGDWRTWHLTRSPARHLAETYSGPGQIPAETSAEHAREVNFT